MRNWFRRESATSFSAKLHPTHDWRILHFQLMENQLLLSSGEMVFTLNRVSSDQLPDWMNKRLATQNLKMDSAEQASDGKGHS
jgi:hypothetical protein